MTTDWEDLSRRGVLAAGGVFAAAHLAGGASPATAGSPMPGKDFFQAKSALMFQSPGEVKIALSKSKYTAAKQRLSAKYAFLQKFVKPACVDSIIYDVTHALENVTPPYNSYQIETLVSSCSQLLDRCLTNRKDMYDMEEQAVRQALEYDLFDKQHDALKDIDLATYLEQQRAAELTAQQNAANKFGAGSDATAQGLGEIAKGTANSTQLNIAGEKGRKASVQKKWDAMEQYQATLQDRHQTPSSALNYTERFSRLEGMLRPDVKVAYLKLRSIAAGAKMIFGLDLPVPAPREFGYLDYMVLYLRDFIEQANIITQNEVVFDRVISLTQAMAPNYLGSSTGEALVGDLKAIFQTPDTSLNFSLENAFPDTIKGLRLISIGASVVFHDAQWDKAAVGDTYHDRSVSVLIFPPATPDPFSTGSYRPNAPVIVGSATWYNPKQLDLISSPHIQNIDPRRQGWKVLVSPNVTNSRGQVQFVAGMLDDVKIHLRCAATIEARIPKGGSFLA